MSHKIYKITNLVTGLCYIGLTKNSLKRRFSGHRKDAGRYKNSKMSIALTEYKNINDWKIELIEDNISRDDVIERERYYIKLYNSFENGYNSNAGSTGNTKGGYKFSDEQKKHLSEVNKGKKPSEYCIQRIRETHLGKKLSEEHKEKIRAWSKIHGTPHLAARKEIHRQEMMGHEYNAQIWKLTNKDGTTLEISNLKKWCRENPEYKSNAFYEMSSGKLKAYKDWIKVEKLTNKYSKKELV